MSKEKNNIPQSNGGLFRIFEIFTEVVGWLQIVASPLLIGVAVGAVIYISDPTTTRLIIGIAIASAGLIVGIIWATKHRKGKGTIWFMSRIIATPDLDKQDEEIMMKQSQNRVTTKKLPLTEHLQ